MYTTDHCMYREELALSRKTRELMVNECGHAIYQWVALKKPCCPGESPLSVDNAVDRIVGYGSSPGLLLTHCVILGLSFPLLKPPFLYLQDERNNVGKTELLEESDTVCEQIKFYHH